MGVRKALLISAQKFEDPKIRQLKSPAIDTRELARVLGDPGIGGFEVQQAHDLPSHQLLREIEEFYSGRKADDLLLLYLSGHGYRDWQGRMYFVCTDTLLKYPRATALSSSMVREIAEESQSKRRVLIVDTCFSGAFPKDRLTKDAPGRPVLVRDDFPGGGTGQVILTASAEFQFSLEGADVQGEPQPSLFTKHIIEGLRTGEADRDNNGTVDVDELYDYAEERTTSDHGAQTPRMWSADMHRKKDFVIARNPYPRKEELPAEIRRVLAGDWADLRVATVSGELCRLLFSSNPGMAAAALEELEHRTHEDDSGRVREAARAVLAEYRQKNPQDPSRVLQPAAIPVSVPAASPINLEEMESAWRQLGRSTFGQLEFVDSSGRPSGADAKVGTQYGLRVAPRSGFLTLLFLSQGNEWTLGYPGWRRPERGLDGGRSYRFPHDLQPFPSEFPDVSLIEFMEPGRETVVALSSPVPLVGPVRGNPTPHSLPSLDEQEVAGIFEKAKAMPEAAFSCRSVQVAP